MKNKETTKQRIERKLQDLSTMKNKFLPSYMVKEWKEKANSSFSYYKEDEEDFRTDVSTVVKRQKDAEFSANLPEFNFIPLNEDARITRKIAKEVWKYHWLHSNSDKSISEVIKNSTTFWTWILYEWIKHIKRKIKTPTWTFDSDWKLEYKEELLSESRISSERIPFENFFINWTDIENSTEAIIIRIFPKDEYINERKDNPIYSKISKVEDWEDVYNYYAFIEWKENKDAWEYLKNKVVEVEYFNSATDEHIILANWIEVLNTPIPYYHKELPFCLFYDNYAEWRIWGIWEYELLKEEEDAKDEYRRLTMKAVKSSIWTIVLDDNSDIDVENTKFWIWEVLLTDNVDALKFFAPSIPVWSIADLESKIDNDIISKSWVDFKSLHLTPNESATKTANKQASTRKRINLNLRDNAFNFFRRLWRLRMANIQLLHDIDAIEIPIEWWTIDNNWLFVKDEADWYGSATIWSQFIKWKYLIVPLIETMLWDNTTRRKENLIQYMQLAWNLVWNDWKPVIKWKQLAKLATDEYWYDFEKLTEESEETQSPEDIVNWIFNENNQQSDPRDDPNYIPPSQRSWAKKNVATISWQAKLPYDLSE